MRARHVAAGSPTRWVEKGLAVEAVSRKTRPECARQYTVGTLVVAGVQEACCGLKE